MALAKHHEEIFERRCANGARILSEYQHPQGRYRPPEKCLERPIRAFPTRDDMIAACETIRQVFQKNKQKYQQRLAQETTFLLKFNADGIGLSESRYLTKGEAAELSGAPWGHILDLENIYGGLLLRGSYLFISEETVSDGLRRYGSDFTLSLLIDDIARERAAA
jgi:hypothetical protein